MVVRISDILKLLGDEAEVCYLSAESPLILIHGPMGRTGVGDAAIGFQSNRGTRSRFAVNSSSATLLLADKSLKPFWNASESQSVRAVAWTENARLAFCQVLTEFFLPKSPTGIDSTANVDPTVSMGAGCYIGPSCVIGEGVNIGDDCVLWGGCHLYPGTKLGNRVTIHAGAVLGADGFGYEQRKDGSWQKFPHFGGVQIGDDVEIGANTTIDRGSLTDTIIGDGVKIDNLVHIAHNVEIGANSLIIAGAIVCGSARIGEKVWVAPQACVREGASVGEGATIGMGAIVNSDAPAQSTMVGWHARSAVSSKKIFSFLSQIGEGINKTK
jgi:UDP-3-O-[3-hydroxymyristoyl] glucosamine N-acyltransferase